VLTQEFNTASLLKIIFPDVNEIDLIITHLKQYSFKKGDILIKPGQTQRNLYLVKSGLQYSYLETDNKQHVIAFTYAPGFSAIPDSFLLQKPSAHYLQCLTDSTFDVITYTDIQLLFDRVKGLERNFRKTTETILSGVIQRQVELQTLPMEERFKTFCERSPYLLNQVPHKLLASYLKIDSTNFSKLYNSIRI
jgi:CRP-like cAMP-binding protein